MSRGSTGLPTALEVLQDDNVLMPGPGDGGRVEPKERPSLFRRTPGVSVTGTPPSLHRPSRKRGSYTVSMSEKRRRDQGILRSVWESLGQGGKGILDLVVAGQRNRRGRSQRGKPFVSTTAREGFQTFIICCSLHVRNDSMFGYRDCF